MKIHRIETFNLASLYGEQHVDFDAGFGDTPIVLVHGPTGAGKSTLLDAVSLALYGQTPRLDGRTSRGNDRGRDFDPANVMSHGTGRCRASVVLSVSGPDGRRVYRRATWEVWRSRDQADGNLQKARRALEALDDPADETGTVLVESQIEKVYQPHFDALLGGLEFADFQRTVLLPQGAFAEFLRGNEDERARLLERLTDTEHFRQIGRRAHDRYRDARDRVNDLKARLDGADLMAEDDLEALRGRHAEAAQARVDAAAASESAVALATWWAELTRRFDAVDRARRDVASAQAARAAESATLDALAAHDALASVYGPLDARDEARSQHADAVAAREAAAASAEAARVADETARAALESASDARTAFEARAERLRPVIDRCGATSDALQTARRAQAEAQAAVEAKAEAGAEKKREVEAHRSRIDELARRLEPLAWLEEADIADKIGQWTAWDEERRRAAGRWRDQIAARDDRAAALEALEAATAASSEARAAIEAAKERAAKELAAATEALVAHGVETPRLDARDAARRRHEERRDALRDALDAVKAAREADRAQIDAARRARETAAQAETAQQAAASASAKVTKAAAAVGAAEVELTRARERRDAAGDTLVLLRAQAALVDGEPCPVCGSTQHPGPMTDDEAGVIARFDAARAEAEEAWTAARGAHAEAVAADQAAQVERARAMQLAETAREAEAVATRARSSALAAIPEPWRVAEASDGLVLESIEGRVLREKERVDDAMQAEQGAWDRFVAAHEEVGGAERALATHDRDQQTAAEKRAGLRQQLASASEAIHALGRDVDALRVKLTAALEASAAPVLARDDAEGVDIAATLQAVHQNLRLARELGADRAEVTKSLQAAETSLAGLDAHLTAARGELETRAATLKKATARHAAALVDLEALVEHRDADAALAELDRDADATKAALESARAASAKAQSDAAAAAATHEAKREDEEKAALAVRAREQAWRDELAAVPADALAVVQADAGTLDEAEVRAARLPDDALADARAVDARTAGAVRDAKSALDARDADVREQLADPPPGAWELADPAEADEVRSEASDARAEVARAIADRADQASQASRAAAAEARDTAASLAEQLRGEDARRSRAAELAGELEAARGAYDLWHRMNELIGAKEGERFQRFAQALGLGELIEAANQRLRVMNPRYRLTVARDGDGTPRLDFAVIDQEQAGRVRAISTLSGGESFMCSLSLALGLADFRHHTLPIETLLLDEGFGTLDRSSVDLVMKALETLSATSGAQVILISHVASLRERVEARVAVQPLGGGRSEARIDA